MKTFKHVSEFQRFCELSNSCEMVSENLEKFVYANISSGNLKLEEKFFSIEELDLIQKTADMLLNKASTFHGEINLLFKAGTLIQETIKVRRRP